MSSAKIELLDIFSYSCMNCLRSLEYIRKLDKKYNRYGLKTTIVHVPEWEFEKNKSNIQNAIRRYKINFPKIIDKDRKLLRKMKVNFWPTQILLKDGREIYRHIGEGNYKSLENKIRTELGINKIGKLLFKTEPINLKYAAIYAGSWKNGKVSKLKDKERIKPGIVYTKGTFLQKKECLESVGKGLIKVKMKGRIANIVVESLIKKPIRIKISYTNNKNKEKPNKKIIEINEPRLYALIQSKENGSQVLEIGTNNGLAIYSFSFQ